jgi:hypothetical protein
MVMQNDTKGDGRKSVFSSRNQRSCEYSIPKMIKINRKWRGVRGAFWSFEGGTEAELVSVSSFRNFTSTRDIGIASKSNDSPKSLSLDTLIDEASPLTIKVPMDERHMNAMSDRTIQGRVR